MNCSAQKPQDTTQCESCLRIFQLHKDWSNPKNKCPNVIVNITQFLNDMNHIKAEHDVEIMSGAFIKTVGPCAEKCTVPTFDSVDNDSLCTEDLVRHLFFGQNHVYLFHPSHSNRGRRKRFVYEPNTKAAHQVCDNQQNINKDQKEKPVAHINDEDNDLHQQQYRFGFPWTYQRSLGSNNNLYFVPPKYKNMREELLQDKEKNLSIRKWQNLIKECEELCKTDAIKRLKAFKSNQNTYGWNTNVDKAISLPRVIAIALYTDMDSFCAKFNETYRTDIDRRTQKRAHYRFAHCAKLLQSSVDIYGKMMTNEHVFYRGLVGHYVWLRVCAQFHMPCSTTKSYSVAFNFALDGNDNGIVLEIKKPEWNHTARFMRLREISAYKLENEYLFFGPDNYLKIIYIHHDITGRKISTDRLLLLQLLTQRVCGSSTQIMQWIKTSSDNGTTQKLCDLLEHIANNKCDGYESVRLMKPFVYKQYKLRFRMKFLQTLMDCDDHRLLSWFITLEPFQINLEKILGIFCNVKKITFDFRGCELKISEKGWYDIATCLRSEQCTIWNIEIENVSELPSIDILDEVKQRFILKESRWKMQIDEGSNQNKKARITLFKS